MGKTCLLRYLRGEADPTKSVLTVGVDMVRADTHAFGQAVKLQIWVSQKVVVVFICTVDLCLLKSMRCTVADGDVVTLVLFISLLPQHHAGYCGAGAISQHCGLISSKYSRGTHVL